MALPQRPSPSSPPRDLVFRVASETAAAVDYPCLSATTGGGRWHAGAMPSPPPDLVGEEGRRWWPGGPAAAAPSPPPDLTGAGGEARSWRTVWRCNAGDHKPTRAPSLDNPSSGGCGSSCPEFGYSRSSGLRRQQRQIQAHGEWMASPLSSNRLCALPSAVKAYRLYGEHVLLLILCSHHLPAT